MADLTNVSTDSLLASIKPKANTPESFSAQYGSIADSVGKQIGVDPRLLLAQWGLETGWGKSVVPGTFNLGNIKDFSGSGVAATDNMTGSRDKYRAYESPDAFASDFAGLIDRKYKGAKGAGADANKYLAGLQGYAEDPNYAAKVQAAYKLVSKNPVMAVADKALSAVSGTARAATPADLSSVSTDDLMASLQAAPATVKTSAEKEEPGTVTNLARGVGHGITQDIIGAPAQILRNIVPEGVGRAVDRFGNYLADLGVPIARVNGAEDLNRQIREKEAQYQKDTEGSVAAGVGRVGANVVGLLGPGGAKAITGGANLGKKIAYNLGGGNAAQTAGRIGGASLGGAGLGAAGTVFTPVTEEGNFGQNKLAQLATSAAVGGALPLAGAGARAAGRGIGNATVGEVSPQVAALANRAKDLGIDVRVDQLANSKPLNALSAALDYLPFSGKSGAITRQQKQFNTAVSRTIGENTDDIAAAVEKSEKRLGGEFDRVLKTTPVNADNALVDDLTRITDDARNELTDAQFGVFTRQIDNILDKVKSGDVIDGEAAYNIKKMLDRLGKNQDTSLAFYARETRNALMDALNRSLPDAGEAFQKTRRQWANLMELQKILPRGAEGNISPARLANSRSIRSKDLGELGDIAGQFLKARVGDSGTAQRAGAYGLLGGTAAVDPTALAMGLTAGRGINSLLSSPRVAQSVVNRSLNAGNPALAFQAPQNALLRALAPNLLPASIVAGSSAFNKP